MFRLILTSIFSLALLSSCKSQSNKKYQEVNPVNLQLVLSGEYSGEETEQLLTINNKSELESFFGKLNRTRKPGFPVPEIDFKNKTVIVWLEGKTKGHSMNLKLDHVSGETIRLRKIKTSNLENKTALLTPFVIYSIPKTAKSITIQ